MLTDSALLMAQSGPKPHFFHHALNGEPWESAVSQLLKTHQIQQAEVTVVLDADQYQQIPLEKPAVPEHELAGALPWSVKDFTNKPIDQLAVDYYDLRSSPSSRARIQVIATPKQLIQSWIKAVHPCELKLVTVDELGLANLFDPESEAVDILLYQLSQHDLTLLVVYQGQLCFSRVLRGFGLLSQQSSDLWSADMVDTLLLELQRSFDYLRSQLKLPDVSRLSLAVEMSDPGALLKLLKQNFSIQIQLMVNPAVVSGIEFLPLYGALQERPE